MRNNSLYTQLDSIRQKTNQAELNIINEAKKILDNDLVSEKKILKNLGHYNNLSEVIIEEDVNENEIFSLEVIKILSFQYRLKFLDSSLYKSEIPLEAVQKVKYLNEKHHRNLKHFKILSLPESFIKDQTLSNSILFAKTNHNQYYKIHQWGNEIPKRRKLFVWPLRNFETLALSILFFTMIEALVLPTNLITLDSKAQYWSGYRGGTFFHLLIFNSAFSTYFFITFAKNFSSNLWNRKNDRD